MTKKLIYTETVIELGILLAFSPIHDEKPTDIDRYMSKRGKSRVENSMI